MNINGFGIQSVDRFAPSSPQRPRATDTEKSGSAGDQASVQMPVPNAEGSRQRAERWQQLNTVYDEPPQSSRRALEAYQGVQLTERREAVKSMFGVDLYA